MEKSRVKECLLVCDALKPHHLFCSRLMFQELRKTRWERKWVEKLWRRLNFGVFYPSFLSSDSTFICLPFLMYFSERRQDRALRQALVKCNMILKNGEIKAEWPHSLTYVKFIWTCLALLLNLLVHGLLNDV